MGGCGYPGFQPIGSNGKASEARFPKTVKHPSLVSWNFKHIVRLEKIRLFNAANIELGYQSLNILSPREVTTHERT